MALADHIVNSRMVLEDIDDGFFHIPRQVGADVLTRIRHLKPGQKMQDLPEELWHKSFLYYVKHDPNRRGGPNLRMIRMDPDKPSLTVTGYVFNKFVHPVEDRFITPREAARLQDFPDGFRFRGTLTSVQQQVGNAVPVRLANAVAKSILTHAEQHRTLRSYLEGRSSFIPALSLFTGIGGIDLGFGDACEREAGVGFRPIACIEWDKDCCATLGRNGFGNPVPTDISEVESPRNYLWTSSAEVSVPIVFGGPPCQAFSQAGKQKATGDDRGRLIFEFMRFVEALRPTYFVMENVANLRGVGGGNLYQSVLSGFRNMGYNVAVHRLCAADYGTPQLRVRLFFVGVENKFPAVDEPERTHGISLDVATRMAAPNPYTSVHEAFDGLPRITQGRAVR